MKEYSRDEINELWKQAYYTTSGAGNPISIVLFFLAFLLIPIALFGFNRTLLLVWILISIFLITFAIYIRLILERSKKGNYPARIAIIRTLTLGPLALLVIWFSFVLLQFGVAYLLNPSSDLVLPAFFTIVIYAAIIPPAFVWGNGETQTIAERREGPLRIGLNMFGGWMQRFFWIAVILQAVILNLLLLVDFRIRIAFVLFPFISLMLFVYIMRNVYFLWTLLKIGIDRSPFQESLKETRKQVEEMAKHSGPTRMPVFCEGCNAQGEIEVDDAEGNYFVICEVCGTETAEVWCDDEGAGGQFVPNIHEHPMEYECRFCEKTHQFPADFYEKPVTLELIEEPRNKKRKK